MKQLIKKLIPKFLLQYYHKFLAQFGAFIYGYPSNKLIIIGVTGTNGKSTTVALIAKVLEAGGFKVGALSTVSFKVAGEEMLNNKKMTMLGRLLLQKYLKRMVDAGCTYAVIETSSQGIEQFRHLGINYDYAVFTNLTPEHIEAHGGFENYKKAKGKLFSFLTTKPRKKINGKKIEKVSVINLDDEHAPYFSGFAADKKITFGINNSNANFVAKNITVTANGTSFTVNEAQFKLKLIGAFNAYNALVAITIAQNEGLTWEKIKLGLESADTVPGRTEMIHEGQPFNVMVDYATDPYSMAKLYETIKIFPKNKVIHVLGSCGGGRDKARRPILGKMAGENADFVIVTNEDPYDDDPMEIINEVAAGAITAGKTLNQNLFKILDRREAIRKVLNLATTNDLVLVTGKGAEQAMAIAKGKYVPWDDRVVIKKLLNRNS